MDGKVSASVNMVSGVSQGGVLRLLRFILYTSDLFHGGGNYIVGHADNTTIYAIIPRLISRPQVIKALNQNLTSKKS